MSFVVHCKQLFLALCAVLPLHDVRCTAADGMTATEQAAPAVGLYQVCMKPLLDLCPNKRTQKFDCLLKKQSQIKDKTCRSWVTQMSTCAEQEAVKTCLKEKMQSSRMTKFQPKRRSVVGCLIESNTELFDLSCTDTDFYRSLDRARERWGRSKQRRDEKQLKLKKLKNRKRKGED